MHSSVFTNSVHIFTDKNTVNPGDITFECGWLSNNETLWHVTNKMHSTWIEYFNTEWTATDWSVSIKHVYCIAACQSTFRQNRV